MKKAKRLAMCLLMLVLVFSTLTVTALAAGTTTPTSGGSAGDFSGVVTKTWNGVKGQIKTVCDSVIFPAIGGILAIWFIVTCCMCYAEYKKSHSLNLTGPIILFVCTIVAFTAPMYIWSVVGW